jgi:hypothetical protein
MSPFIQSVAEPGQSEFGSEAGYAALSTEEAEAQSIHTDAQSELDKQEVQAVHLVVPTKDAEHNEDARSTQTRPSRWQRMMLDTWIPELLAITTSTSCLIAIAVVLSVFTGREPPTLPYGITLNAVIATLATASRSMLLYTVATALSQLKWCWYQKQRKIEDIQIFDDASRGPWGAFSLLIFLRARPLASFGAIITILALAFDPFVQLILTYPTRMVPSQVLTPPPVISAFDFMVESYSDQWTNALEAGIWSEPEAFYQLPSCPSSNCTWPPFHSIGWCHKCQDATASARFTNCDLDALWRNTDKSTSTGCYVDLGYTENDYLNTTIPVFEQLPEYSLGSTLAAPYSSRGAVTTDAVWMISSSFAQNGIGNSSTIMGVLDPVITLARVVIGFTDLDTNGPPTLSIDKAEECILSICDIEYKVSNVGKRASTKPLDKNFGWITRHEGQGGDPYRAPACWQKTEPIHRNDSLYACGSSHRQDSVFCPLSLANPSNLAGLDCTIGDDKTSRYAMSIDAHLSGQRQAVLNDDGSVFPLEFSSPAVQYIATHSLDKALAGISASLSQLSITAQNSTTKIHGTASVVQTYVQPAWYWLVFPFTLVIMSFAFLTLAIVQSKVKNVRPWKASVLPLLYHGLDESILSRQAAPETASGMARLAQDASVRLVYCNTAKKTGLKPT